MITWITTTIARQFILHISCSECGFLCFGGLHIYLDNGHFYSVRKGYSKGTTKANITKTKVVGNRILVFTQVIGGNKTAGKLSPQFF